MVFLLLAYDFYNCHALRAFSAVMSSKDSMGIVFKCLSEGAVDFLVKPIRKNELKNLWQHVWRRCHSVSCYYLPLISDLFYQLRFMVIFTILILFILVYCCLCVWDCVTLCYFSLVSIIKTSNLPVQW